MHCEFVDEMAHTSTSTEMLKEFFKLNAEDFDYTRDDLMNSYYILRNKKIYYSKHIKDYCVL